MPSSVFDAIDDLPPIILQPEIAKILSASSYPHAAGRSTRNNIPDDQMYGGFVATHTGTENDEDEPRPLKRSKSDQTNPGRTSKDVPKRQRGRPKVSGQDETAAERRRTQIRLAQRAYRNRKENTITELTHKVESLQTSIKNVNTGFARLRETLLNAGLIHTSSPVMNQVDDLMRQLSDALESNRSDVEKQSEAEDSDQQVQDAIYDRDHYTVMNGFDMPLDLQGQTLPTISESVANSQSNVLGVGTDRNIFALDGQNLTDHQTYQTLPETYPTPSASTTGPLLPPDQMSLSKTSLALTSIDRFPLKQSYTYSFQETTFSRRLHRLCIERSYQKLLGPHVDPEWLMRTFRLTFNFSNKERIIKAFKDILARSTEEPLENWRSPYVHVGGAGLHFPRRDTAGRPIYPPNLLDPVRAATTFRLPNTETVPTADTFEEILEAVGFHGEWFDCHDVEEYLKSKGIHLEPQSSFLLVNATLSDHSVPELSDAVGTLTSNSSSSPLSHHSMAWDQAVQVHGSADASQLASQRGKTPVILPNTPILDSSIDHWLGEQEGFVPNAFDIELSQPVYDFTKTDNRMVTVEVEKFLESLSEQSVCLGRAPGFRKEHVDNALALAMQEAF